MKRSLVLICLLLNWINSYSQSRVTFRNLMDNNYGSASSNSFVTGLFNGDSIPDVAIARYISGSGEVVVMLGNGDGSFAPQSSYGVGSFETINTADYNNDGKADLLAWTSTATMQVLLGNGNGAFTVDTIYSLPGSVAYHTGAVSKDFDNDGNVDLAVNSVNSGIIRVLMGTGTGRFTLPVTYTTTAYISALLSDDFNADSILDLFGTCASGTIVRLFGNGNGTFTTAPDIPVGANPIPLVTTDFNNDGFKDLITANAADTTISICYGSGNGSFGSTVTLTVGITPYALTSGDFDLDGNADFAIGCAAGMIEVRLNRGSGLFERWGYESRSRQLTTCDFNFDGILDIGAIDQGGVETLIGLGNGHFDCIPMLVTGKQPLAIAKGDFNSDGKTDLVSVNYGSNDITVFLDSIGNYFSLQKTTTVGNGPYDLATGDFNSDGKLDVVVANMSSNNIYILRGNNNGTFANPIIYGTGPTPTAIKAPDVNNDNKPDIAVTHSNGTSIFVNSGSGNFSLSQTVLNTPSPDFADFDQDGKTDILTVGTGSVMAVYPGTGSGTFSPSYSVNIAFAFRHLRALDVNGDSILDLAIGRNQNNHVDIYHGLGGGSYSSATTYSLFGGNGDGYVHFGDFDTDGLMDFVIAGNGAKVYRGCGVSVFNGQACFDPVYNWTDGISGSSISSSRTMQVVDDFNGDGMADIACLNDGPPYYGQAIAIYYNNTAKVAATNACTGSSVTLRSAFPAASYLWNPGGSTLDSLVVTVPGTYSLTTASMNGGTSSTTSFIVDFSGCVWPGDADENLVVDNLDLFTIGLEMFINDWNRSTFSNTWNGYMSKPWFDTLTSGKNTKFADCNGDGWIDLNDTVAINLNYGLTHPARYAAPQIIHSSNSDIYLTFNKSLYSPGDTVYADVNIGDSNNVQNNFYGAAFTLNYDNTKLKPGSEQFYYNNSWVGNINQSKIKLAKIFSSAGKVDASLVRITKTDIAGFGKVATFRMILRDTLNASQLYFTVTNSTKTDHNGIYSSLNTGTDSVALQTGVVGIKQNGSQAFLVYPNPANQMLKVDLGTQNSVKEEIKIFNLLGTEALRVSNPQPHTSIDISSLSPGVYILQAGNQRVRFVKE